MGHQWPGSDQPDNTSWSGWTGGSWSGQDYRRNRRGAGGPPPWLQEIFGLAAPQRPAPRGPRVRRGDVRTAIIDVLHRAATADEPINGYQVIQQIADLSEGEWRPSPGSVYPTIQQLQDEGLVESDDARGRRTIRLTTEGTAWAEANTAELAAVWEPFRSATSRPEPGTAGAAGATGQGADIKSEIGQVMSAVWQLVTQGSSQQKHAALDVLVDTRRRLYGILADGRDGDAG
jgi:DNA-binding PadR family transcriptional regulator